MVMTSPSASSQPISPVMTEPSAVDGGLLTISTTASLSFHVISDQLRDEVRRCGMEQGALVASCLHTTTALVVNEFEERLLQDLEDWLERLAPAGQAWKHNDLHLREGIPPDEPRNAHAHLQAMLLGNDVCVPIINGQLRLGRYQDVILVELDGPRQRKVAVQILSGDTGG